MINLLLDSTPNKSTRPFNICWKVALLNFKLKTFYLDHVQVNFEQ